MPELDATVRVSVLDTAPIVQGSDAATALRNSVDLAQLADTLGYHRYWLPEHHGMRGVASAAPAIGVDRIASTTRHLRVGAGGVMLPNHPPLVVAEQFGTLHAFHPGRIDLGLGRGLGGPRAVVDRIRSETDRNARPFAEQVRDLLGYFAPQPDDVPVPAVPAAGNRPEIWLLGSSDHAAGVAGALGLRYAFAHHLQPANTDAAVRTYRDRFTPSCLCPRPRLLLSVAAIVAATDDEARWHAAALRMKIASREPGHPIRLPDPRTAEQHGYTCEHLPGVLIGAPATVRAELHTLVTRTGADELMIKTDIHDHTARRRSYQLLADHLAEHPLTGTVT